ncbi:hypothetical protein [Mycoplasma testudineum]|uniref:hypothetical protein n=1 Tax=Mycoplasma testudineum TaxID=244584 RepID=UPI001414EE83|nr:hypothetical protein [Mycoplasma testudineum]
MNFLLKTNIFNWEIVNDNEKIINVKYTTQILDSVGSNQSNKIEVMNQENDQRNE